MLTASRAGQQSGVPQAPTPDFRSDSAYQWHSASVGRTLQEFLSLHRWDEDRLRWRIHQRVAFLGHSGRHVIGLIDETSFLKKGDKTPGVQRQYCGTTGKTDNCTVTVHLGLADGAFHVLLDSELYLPESWAQDPARCRAAKILESMTYRPKTQIALELIDRAVAHGLQFGWFTFDEGYGGKPPFLAALQARGHRYVGEVPKTFRGWAVAPPDGRTLEDGLPGNPRGDSYPSDPGPARTVEEEARRIDQSSPRLYHIKDTHQGPEVWSVGGIPFYPEQDGRPGPLHWLLVATPATGGNPKYFLSNASPGVPLEVLLSVAFSRWHIERCFQDQKGQIGLDHFAVRNYLSLKRHLILSALSFLFLTETCQRLRGEKSGMDGGPDPARRRASA